MVIPAGVTSRMLGGRRGRLGQESDGEEHWNDEGDGRPDKRRAKHLAFHQRAASLRSVTVANKGASRSVEGGRVARARTIIEPSDGGLRTRSGPGKWWS